MFTGTVSENIFAESTPFFLEDLFQDYIVLAAVNCPCEINPLNVKRGNCCSFRRD